MNVLFSPRQVLDAALGHLYAGRLTEAKADCEALLKREPDNVQALHVLGMVLNELGHFEESVAALSQATRRNKANPVLRNALGVALRDANRLPEADHSLREAVRLAPGNADALANLGEVRRRLGRPDDARQVLERAIAINGDHALAHDYMGRALFDLGSREEALACFRRADLLDPRLHLAHASRGALLESLGRLSEAEQQFRAALQLAPANAAAHADLGKVLCASGRTEEGFACYRAALQLDPLVPEVYANYAVALFWAGRVDDAVAACRRALELNPGLHETHSNLLVFMDIQERVTVELQQAERARWNRLHAEPLAPVPEHHGNLPDPTRKLRVGYVSGDFREHSAIFAIAPIVTGHDRTNFEVVCYSSTPVEDAATQRLRQAADLWRNVQTISDAQLAQKVREDGIDILVDLSGHSAHNRLLAFARKPAPIQITAWGYATGTGMRTMDYFLADPVVVRADERDLFAEKILDIPCVIPYEIPAQIPAVQELPAQSSGYVTFGCFNRLEKISEEALAAWTRIVMRIPNSVLLIKDRVLDDQAVQQRLRDRMSVLGFPLERLELHGRSAHMEHLELLTRRVDVALDPFPHCGGISTAEALAMGVPVVTLDGKTPVGRLSSSMLVGLGMSDWIGESLDDYVNKAVAAAEDIPRLRDIRGDLRARVVSSPFGDTITYVRKVEETYREVWRRWCDKQRTTRAPEGHP